MSDVIQRGSTPEHTFQVGIDLRAATKIYISYYQLGQVVVEKTKDELKEIEEDHIVVRLSQEDTLKFKDNSKVEMQIRALFDNGDAPVSDIMVAETGRLLKGGVI